MSAFRGKADTLSGVKQTSQLAPSCPLMTAGSTGRRNTCIKSLCWGFELQSLTWPFVELTRYFVRMSLRVHRQVGSLQKLKCCVDRLRPPPKADIGPDRHLRPRLCAISHPPHGRKVRGAQRAFSGARATARVHQGTRRSVVNFIQIFLCTSVRCCRSNCQLKAAGHLRAALSSQAASLIGPNSAQGFASVRPSRFRSRRQLIAHKQRKGA
jgi:hypothetical protein